MNGVMNQFSKSTIMLKEVFVTGTVVPAMIGVDGLSGSPDYVGGWGFCDVSKEVYDIYEETDQRRDGGILCMEKYIADCAARGIVVKYGGRYQNTGLFLRKYIGRIGGNDGATKSGDLNWDNNQRIFVMLKRY